MQQGKHLKRAALERAMHARAAEVLPVRARLAISQKKPSIVEPARAKVMHLPVYDRDRTDPAVTHRSKRDHPQLAPYLALRDVVKREVPLQQDDRRCAPFGDHDGFLGAQDAALQCRAQRPRAFDPKRRKDVPAHQQRPASIKLGHPFPQLA